MDKLAADKIMVIVERMRKQPVSRFSGITVDMDYEFCVPSVHTLCQGEEIIISIGGGIMSQTNGFPKDKTDMLIQWVLQHENEIVENHIRITHHAEPLLMIDPPNETI